MKTVFEKSVKGRCGVMPAALDVERYDFDADRLRDGLVLPELSEEEETKVAALVANLPKGLRESVSRAMSASYRAQNSRHS